jgi:formiminotetrahydrofolate cyclodeaminase
MRERSLGELLDALAGRTPAPGGGTAAALAGALAAALVEMAAAFTLGRESSADVHPRMEQVLARAAELRERLLELAEVELHAYEPVLAALSIAREDPQRSERLAAARSEAAQSPFEIAVAAAEVAALGAEVAGTGNPNLEGDALTACALSEAACSAASRLVEINLREGEGDPGMGEARDPRAAQARELSKRAHAERRGALSR